MSVTMPTVRRVVALFVSTLLTFMWVPGLLLTPTANAAGTQLVDRFEIDGNLSQDSAVTDDWQNVLVGPSSADPVGTNENSVFQTSSKEDDAATSWVKGTSNVDP